MPISGARQPDLIALRFGRLWTGTSVVSPATVLVRGDRVALVSAASDVIPADARVIDLTAYTGLPGLIDLHTHMTYYWDRQPGTRPLGQRRGHDRTRFIGACGAAIRAG